MVDNGWLDDARAIRENKQCSAIVINFFEDCSTGDQHQIQRIFSAWPRGLPTTRVLISRERERDLQMTIQTYLGKCTASEIIATLRSAKWPMPVGCTYDLGT